MNNSVETKVKVGFKQTEVGLIPEDWEVETFENTFTFLNSGTFSRAQLYANNDVKCIHYGDIHTKFNHYIDFSLNEMDGCTYKEAKRYDFVQNGDIVMADASEDTAGIGKSVEIKNLKNKAIAGLHTFLLRDKGFFIDGFRGYIHSMLPVKSSLDRLATGLKVYGISKANLKNILIPIPPLQEQKAIATALSDVDALIQSLDALIAKKKAIKQGAMQELLTPPHSTSSGQAQKGGKRLDGFSGEWVEKKLGECLKYEQPTNYIVESSDYEGQSQTPVLTAGKSFLLGYTDEKDGVYTNLPAIIFDDFTTSIQFVDFRFKVKSSAMKILTPNSLEIDLTFIYAIMQLIPFSLGDEHKRRWITEFSRIVVRIPEIEEQKAIAQIFSDMDLEIESLEKKKEKYEEIKQGMMQELLMGKTRLI